MSRLFIMLQIKVLSPLMINANDFKKYLFLDIFLVYLYRSLLPLYWISCSYNGSHDTKGQEPSQSTHLWQKQLIYVSIKQNNSKYEWNIFFTMLIHLPAFMLDIKCCNLERSLCFPMTAQVRLYSDMVCEPHHHFHSVPAMDQY